MVSQHVQKQCPLLGSRCRRSVAFAIPLSALLSGIAAPRVHAQTHELTDQWVRDGGTVAVSPGALNIEEGESLTYRIRLTKPLPTENGNQVEGWWVRIHVDGGVRVDGVYDADGDGDGDGDGENDIRWVPSVGWEFNPSDWPAGQDESRWREITVWGLSTLDKPVTFKHEVWDHDAYCPQGLHPDGLPVVTVNVIPDRPPEPLPTLSIGEAARVIEGGDASFEVRLSKSSQRVVTVAYATMTGTADEGSDFERASGTLTFDPDTTSQTLRVPTKDDETDESDETFTVKLSSPNGATLDDDTGTGTIGDNDAPPKLSIGDAPAVTEGGTALFPVTLNVVSGRLVTVMYRTVDGTAMAGPDLDYITTAGKLEFEAGTTRQTIAVQTSDDELSETQENFTAELYDATESTVKDDTGQGTIRDNDPLPELSVADISPVPEGGTATFTVTLNAPSGQTVTVQYETRNGTATAGSDYTAKSGELVFEPGDTEKTVSVTVLDDTVPEDPEEFTVELSSPSAARLKDHSGAVTITDDDVVGPLPSLSIADAEPVGEGGEATFTVTLSPASSRLVTVKYATRDGTAVADSDYTPASETISFAAGEETKEIRVSRAGRPDGGAD